MLRMPLPPQIEFRPLAEPDLPLLHEWLSRPHVATWWARELSVDDVREKYLPRIAGGTVRPYVAWIGGEPIGYVQSYVAAGAGDGWWENEHDPGVRGIDQFLADPARLGQGLGTAMVSQFVAQLFGDPAVTRVQADPRTDNARAIRCYEKAGFRSNGVVQTPDGAALLMVLDRAGHERVHALEQAESR